MPIKNDHMVRITDEVYTKLVAKRGQLMHDHKQNFTVSEVIEICILEANIYEGK